MTDYALKTEDLSVKFFDHLALEAISFGIPPGAFLAIVGPNGAGKSTLIKAALGLIKPAGGSIEVLGRPPRGVAPGEIGYVPQVKTADTSFPGKAIELVLSGIHQRWPSVVKPEEREKAMAALEKVGAQHLAERNISRLSGGETQRIYLARAMVCRPKITMLDEPATGVDLIAEANIYHLLDDYQEQTGSTVVMITHDWDTAYYHASHVLVLNHRVIGFGSPKEVFTEECLRKAYGHTGHGHIMLLGMNKHD